MDITSGVVTVIAIASIVYLADKAMNLNYELDAGMQAGHGVTIKLVPKLFHKKDMVQNTSITI